MKTLALTTFIATVTVGAGFAAPSGHSLKLLERSYWLHASLGASMVKGYWAPDAPAGPAPTASEVRNAARVLAGHYHANRLYLIYHKEVPIPEFGRLLRHWREACPAGVDLVPTLVLRMYDKAGTLVFTADEAREVCTLARQAGCRRMAVYDVMPGRDQGPALEVLAGEFPGRLIRVGVQPEEKIGQPFSAAVQDTWSGISAGRSHEDWLRPGFGADTLRGWVRARNAQSKPVAWDLIAVAWDYSSTEHGEYPGYDDAAKNDPLSAVRNALGLDLILNEARPGLLRGFSSDLLIVESNARHPNRDGPAASLYPALKAGRPYRGTFAGALDEIASLYGQLAGGRVDRLAKGIIIPQAAPDGARATTRRSIGDCLFWIKRYSRRTTFAGRTRMSSTKRRRTSSLVPSQKR